MVANVNEFEQCQPYVKSDDERLGDLASAFLACAENECFMYRVDAVVWMIETEFPEYSIKQLVERLVNHLEDTA